MQSGAAKPTQGLPRHRPSPKPRTKDVPDPAASGLERAAPSPGEARYYKKHYERRGGGDKMLPWHDCGHDCWTANAYAPQARLGIEKCELEATVVRLQKCLSCTGGGVWRATF